MNTNSYVYIYMYNLLIVMSTLSPFMKECHESLHLFW